MKFHKKGLKNKPNCTNTAVTATRKDKRKAARREKKKNKAIHYVKNKIRTKESNNNDELDNITTKKNVHTLSSLGKETHCSNDIKNKKKKTIEKYKKKILNSTSTFADDMNFQLTEVRQTQPPKHNYEPEEQCTDINKSKILNNVKNVQKCKLIKDKKRLENLRADQEIDTMEINKLARNLQLTSHQKKKGSFIDVGFRDILNDIESGKFSDGNKYGLDDNDDLDNFEKDMQSATGKNPKNIRKLDENGENVGNEESEFSESDEEQISEGDNYESFSGSNHEEGSCSEMASEEECSNLNGFLDAEAEEDNCSDDSDSGMVDDDDIIFESGSTLPSCSGSAKLSFAPSMNSFFDIYSSDSENDEADLEDFVVDDDVVEYQTDCEDIDGPVTEKGKKEKQSRIVGRKLKRLNDSDVESDHAAYEQVVPKRRRITSEDSESEVNDGTNNIPTNILQSLNSSLNLSMDQEVLRKEKKRRKGSKKGNAEEVRTISYSQKEIEFPAHVSVKGISDNSSVCDNNKNCDIINKGFLDNHGIAKNTSTKHTKTKLKSEKKRKNIVDVTNTASVDGPVPLNGEVESSGTSSKKKNLNDPSFVNGSVQIPKNEEQRSNCDTKIAMSKSRKKRLRRKAQRKKKNCSNEEKVDIKGIIMKSKQLANITTNETNLNLDEETGNKDSVKLEKHYNNSTENVTSKPEKGQNQCKKGNINGVKLPKSILKQDSLTVASKGNQLRKQVSFSVLNSETDKDVENAFDENETLSHGQDTENVSQSEVLHEDIYGRLRDNSGRIINHDSNNGNNGTKYTPPALRKLMELNSNEKKRQQMAALQRQLKGLLNRLTESNIAGIVSQVERLYQTNSRNDMNDSLVKILFDMLVTPVLAPERLVQEQALFIAILSANVGTEVGAQVLTEFIVKWDEDLDNFEPTALNSEIDSKELDNMLLFISNLYNFKVMNSGVLYDMMNKLQGRHIGSKEVDLILLILKNVGFTLRKDDPMALKNFITEIQSKVSTENIKTNQQEENNFTRVKFMLEILVAIRNNNMSKVPSYDPTHIQHLQALMKGLIKKGCRTSELSVSLQDLIKSKTLGKWWIVGSAWSKELKENSTDNDFNVSSKEKLPSMSELKYSDQFYKKAEKLRMTRPPRINILYAITEGAENYIDAFQKLTELKLPPKQEKEIFNVMIYCCIRCKEYTEFYAYLALKLCEFKKEYQRLLQFSIWDKFKQLDEMKPNLVANLAKFIVHVVAENGLNLTVFKILNFAEANEKTVSLLRQALIGILLYPAGTFVVNRAFSYLCKSPKFNLLKQYIRVFILKFVNPSKCNKGKEMELLESRVKMVLEILTDAGITL